MMASEGADNRPHGRPTHQARRWASAYSNVLATVAIFVAMGGGAYAGHRDPDEWRRGLRLLPEETGALRVVKKGKRCEASARSPGTLSGRPDLRGEELWPEARVRRDARFGGNQRASGATSATGATGPAGPTTPENVPLLSNWGSFGNPSWTNQPAALTELFGTTAGRLKADLTASTQGAPAIQR